MSKQIARSYRILYNKTKKEYFIKVGHRRLIIPPNKINDVTFIRKLLKKKKLFVKRKRTKPQQKRIRSKIDEYMTQGIESIMIAQQQEEEQKLLAAKLEKEETEIQEKLKPKEVAATKAQESTDLEKFIKEYVEEDEEGRYVMIDNVKKRINSKAQLNAVIDEFGKHLHNMGQAAHDEIEELKNEHNDIIEEHADEIRSLTEHHKTIKNENVHLINEEKEINDRMKYEKEEAIRYQEEAKNQQERNRENNEKDLKEAEEFYNKINGSVNNVYKFIFDYDEIENSSTNEDINKENAKTFVKYKTKYMNEFLDEIGKDLGEKTKIKNYDFSNRLSAKLSNEEKNEFKEFLANKFMEKESESVQDSIKKYIEHIEHPEEESETIQSAHQSEIGEEHIPIHEISLIDKPARNRAMSDELGHEIIGQEINVDALEDEEEGGSKVDQGGLTMNQVNKLMGSIKGYIGAFTDYEIYLIAKEIVQQRALGQKEFAFILLLQARRHFVGVYMNEYELCYFDPFGLPISKNLYGRLRILLNVIEHAHYLKLKINRIKEQSVDSSNCGYISCAFLLQMLCGMSFKKSTNYNVHEREEMANNMRLEYKKFGFI